MPPDPATEESATQTTLGITELLQEILGALPYWDMMKARLIERRWNEAATKIAFVLVSRAVKVFFPGKGLRKFWTLLKENRGLVFGPVASDVVWRPTSPLPRVMNIATSVVDSYYWFEVLQKANYALKNVTTTFNATAGTITHAFFRWQGRTIVLDIAPLTAVDALASGTAEERHVHFDYSHLYVVYPTHQLDTTIFWEKVRRDVPRAVPTFDAHGNVISPGISPNAIHLLRHTMKQ